MRLLAILEGLLMTSGHELPARVAVTAPPGSRLEELLASYESAKAAAEEATGRFRAVTDAIKAELASATGNAPEAVLSGGPGMPRLRLAWRVSWRLDSKRLKEQQPALYVQYAVQSGTYELRAL